jgi:hypothetical protein
MVVLGEAVTALRAENEKLLEVLRAVTEACRAEFGGCSKHGEPGKIQTCCACCTRIDHIRDLTADANWPAL